MATDFSNKTNLSKPLTIGSKKQNDMPLDVRTRIETLDEISKIEYPFIGMLFYVKETDKYYSVKSLRSEELVPGVPSTEIENFRVGEYEEFEADSSTEEDILISGVPNLGGLMEGQVIPAGTTFTEFLKMLLQKPEYFEYVQPELLIQLNPARLEQEVGTKITPNIEYVYNQNDAGEIISVVYEPIDNKNQMTTTVLDEGNEEFSVTIEYAEGKQKYDDFGNPVGKPIPYGQLKATCKYEGFRYTFFGADDKTVPFEDGAEIRSFEKTIRDKFSIEVPAGSQRVFVAVPANGKQPVSIEYEQQGGAEYISNFIPNVVSVSGATNGKNMMDYNVYTFIFLIPCGAAMSFEVTLD